MTAQATDPFAMRQPDNAANRVFSDYGNAANVGGPGTASLNVGRFAAGNGWLYLGTQQQYTRLVMRLDLDGGYFGPEDNATWPLQSATWSPTPSQSAGLTATYDITYGATGLCWLTNAPGTIVDSRGRLRGHRLGQGRHRPAIHRDRSTHPSHLEYKRSISTIQIAKIPQWEWPMRFETPENIVDTVIDGVVVTLEHDVLKIDDLEIELQDAGE